MALRARGAAMRRALARLRAGELGALTGDSLYSALWMGAISLADLVQIALVTNTLGLEQYGRLALVISFVVLVGQFFDLRVQHMTMAFGAEHLLRGSRPATGVFQFSYLVDSTTGILGFVVVALLASFVGPSLLGDDGAILLIAYAFSLLCSTVTPTSMTIVRLLDRFRLLAVSRCALEVLRIGLIVGALTIFNSILAVLIALVIYEAVTGVVNALMAASLFHRKHPEGRLMRPAIAAVRHERRSMLKMLWHTNIWSYSRIAQVQLPTVLLGALVGPTQVGVYKIGMAAAAIVRRVADPAQTALTPRIARLWSAGQQVQARRLVEQAALMATVAMSVLLLIVVLAREPVLELLGGGSGVADAVPVLILAAVAQAISGAMFWSMSTLVAARRSVIVAWTSLAGAAIQLALVPLLVPSLEATGAALAYLVSLAVGNLAAGWFAWRTLRDAAPRRAETRAPPVPDSVS